MNQSLNGQDSVEYCMDTTVHSEPIDTAYRYQAESWYEWS